MRPWAEAGVGQGRDERPVEEEQTASSVGEEETAPVSREDGVAGVQRGCQAKCPRQWSAVPSTAQCVLGECVSCCALQFKRTFKQCSRFREGQGKGLKT